MLVSPYSSIPSFSQIYLHIIFPLFLKTNATAPSRASQLLIHYSKPYFRLNVWGSRKLLYPSHRKYFSFRSPLSPPLWIFHSTGPTLPRINFPNYNINFGTTRKEHLLLSFLTKLMIAFVRRHPILVFLWHKGRNFWAITCDCRLAAPINHLGQETELLSTQFCFCKWRM